MTTAPELPRPALDEARHVAVPPRTVLPAVDPAAPPPVRRTGLGRATAEERVARAGAWVAGFALAWLLTQRVLPLASVGWLLLLWFVLGMGLVAVTTALVGNRNEVADQLVRSAVTVGALVVGAALVSVMVFTLAKGWRPLLHLNFFTDDMAGIGPRDAFDRGGILHAVAGSLIQLGIAIAITVPLGIGTAVFMTEVGGRFATVVRTVVEAMTALPSIVAGLFVYTVMVVALGYPRSGLAAGLAIAVMMLPIIARASDVVLRVVPSGLREAGLALGASRWRVVWHVVLPTARPGLATALILGVARGVGETSPVLLTSGAAPFLTLDPTSGFMNSLPLYVFSTVRSGEPQAIARGFAAASVLLVLVLVLFVTARLLARGPLSKRS
ncbi:phosphate ABC transporter permease PstA [Nocardioides zeae]|uniref:Phosphate transport system permease protein PstA n=1 Tax=Nocardioides zeae TaxID=1457234 RepID=A0AAJ1U5M6_9ACTN|nr:phosphate ABC transporter permease PstA [Nocardioides zeae]MDQ1104567.1 phosphate transport system permease protein [Nocardioides zeae]